MRPLVALLLTLAPVLASAQTLEVTPLSPDSTQRVNIRFSGTWPDTCVPSDPRASIDGRTITVRYRIVDNACFSTATMFSRDLTIGPLAPGFYTVLAVFGNDSRAISEQVITVRQVVTPFKVAPAAVSKATGGAVVITGARGVFCESGIANCDTREVIFGDKSVVLRVNDFSFDFTVNAPPQQADAVDVTIKYPDGKSDTARAALRYFDPAAPPDPALFERILLPITRDVRGAFGSDFRVALAVYNDNRFAVPLWRPEISLAGSAQTTLRSEKPNGALIFPLRSATERLYFASNARDVSRVSETFGTEVRVVREDDGRVGDSELLNIPADPNFRLNLRLFGIDAIDGSTVQVSLHSPDNRVFYGDMTVTLAATAPDEPAFAMITDLRAAFPGLQTITSGTFRIHLQGGHGIRYWPMLTVTNNTTQQITTVTPQ